MRSYGGVNYARSNHTRLHMHDYLVFSRTCAAEHAVRLTLNPIGGTLAGLPRFCGITRRKQGLTAVLRCNHAHEAVTPRMLRRNFPITLGLCLTALYQTSLGGATARVSPATARFRAQLREAGGGWSSADGPRRGRYRPGSIRPGCHTSGPPGTRPCRAARGAAS